MNVHPEVAVKRVAQAYQQLESAGHLPARPSEHLEVVVAEHAALVRRVARRLARNSAGAVDIDDLTSVGIIGLIDAHRKYDPAGGREFRVYAEYRIRGAMLDELRRLDPMSQPMRRRARALEQAERRLATELGRPPLPEELADRLGLSVEGLQAAQTELQPKNFVPDTELDDVRADLADSPHDRSQLQRTLVQGIAQLPERLQQVLSLYYMEDLTLKEIGEVLGVTEARVCQLHKAAVVGLRRVMEEEGLS